MTTKRGPGPEFVSNPFIKKKNLEWSLDLSRPTHSSDESSSDELVDTEPRPDEDRPETSAVEAGEAELESHLEYFSKRLIRAMLSPFPPGMPRLSIEGFRSLYEANSDNPKGAHFIVHQHDHPIAGTHYDLRLQINETSSASWAVMFGLPGDPNSKRLNRNATETRIHCLWNHLIETASASTGSLLIWDTGTYTVLPPRERGHGRGRGKQADTDSQSSEAEDTSPELTEQEKLHRAFQTRKIRIRLNGTRLPHNYVLNLRLTTTDDIAGRAKSARPAMRRSRRGGASRGRGARGRGRGKGKGKAVAPMTSSDSDSDPEGEADDNEAEVVKAPAEEAEGEDVSAMEREIRELADETVRRTNAYAGATNSIGSVHQRRWYLSLDRPACGFAKRREAGRVVWESETRGGSVGKGAENSDGRLTFPFYVRGVEVERSVMTGRIGADALRDWGVEGFVGRKGWRPVLN
ncbi:DNA polymerase ligase-domain-containing protein [Hypoxylon sp. NC1633]|nr:DNA polymerase ligase-domain-containing protein [Hypoxylon sp. NC1633]